MKKKGNNAYAYISIVAIVAIVSLFVMFAGSGSKETQTPQTIVLDSGFGGDIVGDARRVVDIPTQTIYNQEGQNIKTVYIGLEDHERISQNLERDGTTCLCTDSGQYGTSCRLGGCDSCWVSSMTCSGGWTYIGNIGNTAQYVQKR